MKKSSSMVEKLFACFAVLCTGASMYVDAADGVWRSQSGGGNWNSTTLWENGVVPGGGADDIAYLYVNQTGKSLTITDDVVLHAIVNRGMRGCNVALARTSGSTAAFKMMNDPFITAAPVYNHSQRLVLRGDGIMVSGDESPLTLQGGQFNLEGGSHNYYAFVGFPRVDLKNMFSITMLTAGGIADGDVRLLGARLNFDYNHSALTTTNNLVGGRLIIGSGMNYARMGYKGAIRFPETVVREKAGVFSVLANASGNVGYSLAAPLETYMKGKGRFPTWWLYGTGSENHFLSYNGENGFVNANLASSVALVDATANDTVILSAKTTLDKDSVAAAIQVKGGDLDLNGKMLTLGNDDEPGLLMLQGYNVNGADGSIVFEGADGIIVVNKTDKRIGAKLVGTNSLTVVAGVESAVNRLHLDNVANSFSGGLDILNGHVSVTNGGSLGTGPVYVHGYPASFDYGTAYLTNRVYSGAGTLYVNGCTITNDLFLSGMGASVGNVDGRPVSALYLQKGASVESAITLVNDTAIRSEGNAGVVDVSSAVQGNHDIYFSPGLCSTIRFAGSLAENQAVQINGPHHERTMTRQLGTFLLASESAIGDNDVKNNGTLMFENSRTFSNALTGEGSYKQTSDIDVVFTKPVTQQGGIFVDKGTVTLQGSENTLGGLAGAGTLAVSGTSTLTLGSNESCYDAYYQGDIQTTDGGQLTLVKSGTNTQIFAQALSFDGDVVVNEGTLKLGGIGATLPKTIHAPQVHVDATDAASVETGDDDTVENWVNKGSLDADLVQPIEEKKPVYDPSAMGGKGGVVFYGSNNKVEPYVTNRLYLAQGDVQKNAVIERAFLAFSVRTQTMFGGLLGNLGKDSGIRLGYTDRAYNENGGTFDIDRPLTWNNDTYLLNGVKKKTGDCHKVYVFEQSAGEPLNWCVALGHYFEEGVNRPRAFNGAIGEVLLYADELNPQEEFTVRAWFNNKWDVKADTHAVADILPVGGTLTVNVGATVDFAGVSQTLERLENYGTITNSSTTPVVITVKNAVLSGKVAGNVKVVIDGGHAYLKNWRNMLDLPFSDSLAFHLDGAALTTLQRNADGQVTNWVDKSGNGMDFREDVNGLWESRKAILNPPTFDASLYGGRGGVKFVANQTDADGANRLSMEVGKSCSLRTVFIVTQTDQWTYFGGLIGPRNDDNCLRLTSTANTYSWYPFGRFDSNLFYVNGKAQKNFEKGKPHVLNANVKADSDADFTWALGQYFKVEVADVNASNFATVGGLRGYCGSVAEVVAYDRDITAEERASVTRYLTDKWLSEDANLNENVLGDDVTIGLLNGATLDMGGLVQTINGISGTGGTIVNGDATIRGTLEVPVNADGEVVPYVFDGATLADGLRIVLNGQPSSARVVIARGVKSADVKTFVSPSRSWTISLTVDGDLVLSMGGTVLLFR